VHTFAKARLTSVAIWIRDPDRHQNLVINVHWPIANCLWKFLCKSVRKLCTNLLIDRQTNNDNYITSLAEVTRRHSVHAYFTTSLH